MEIDLLKTDKHVLGLLANGGFESAVSGVSFEEETHTLILEMGEAMDSFALNVPVGYEIWEHITKSRLIHFGIIQKGRITHAAQLPMISGEYAGLGMPPGRMLPISSYQRFLEEVTSGQAIHRDDLSEGTSGIVTGGVAPATLQLAPQLEHALELEKSQGLDMGPTLAPPTPKGPGGLGGSSLPTLNLQNRAPKPPTNTDGGEGDT